MLTRTISRILVPLLIFTLAALLATTQRSAVRYAAGHTASPICGLLA